MKKIYLGSFVFIFFLSIFVGILLSSLNTATTNKPVEMTYLSERNTTTFFKDYEVSITLGAIGDILIHDWVYEDAYNGKTYDFNPMFARVKHLLEQPDILLANQETILGGVEIGLSSYPTFNSPQEVGDALINNGVDIVSTANNHSLDRGSNNLIRSLDYMDKINLPYVGTYRSFEEQKQLRILENNGIKVGYLSYTYGTNGIPVPEGKEYLVNLIDKDKMAEEISRMKEAADVIVMSIHWGNEYIRFPNNVQKDLAQFLTNEGVDIIFGHHPHVLQPMEWLYDENQEPTLVVYSLGNFLSGQNTQWRDIGGMATVDVTKKIIGNETAIELSNVQFEPTFVKKVDKVRDYEIIPLQDVSNYHGKSGEVINKEVLDHMLEDL